MATRNGVSPYLRDKAIREMEATLTALRAQPGYRELCIKHHQQEHAKNPNHSGYWETVGPRDCELCN